MKSTEPPAHVTWQALVAFRDTMQGLRCGAISLYVEAFLWTEDEAYGPLIQAADVRHADRCDDGYAVELCGAGLWARVTDDFGNLKAYRMVTP